jgi:tRNA nucleotidyltransferase (CCA-adding enzyme)
VPPNASSRTATATSPRRSQRREPGLGMAAMLASSGSGGPSLTAARDHSGVDAPPAPVLWKCVEALPATAPLLARVGDPSRVYVVGGAVRDLLLGGEPKDLDVVVEGDAAALAERLGATRIYDRFGTATAVLDGFTYDIAQARTESYATAGALPDVTPTSLREDLLRRDFTINTLAIALGGPEPGTLHQAPLALEDLEAGLVRVLHPQSFLDDPTRLLRLVRYASRLRFTIEPDTLELAHAAVAFGALGMVSGSRIGAELRLMAREPDPIAAFELLAQLEFDAALAPGFGLRDIALARRAVELLPSDGRRDLVVLMLAAQHVPPHELAGLLGPLAFVASERDAILAGDLRAEGVAHALQDAGSPSQIAQAIHGAGPEIVAIAGALGPAEQAREWLERLRQVRLEIGGDDLRAAGIAQGPAIGRALLAALAAKLDGRVSGAEQELAEALRAARRKG